MSRLGRPTYLGPADTSIEAGASPYAPALRALRPRQWSKNVLVLAAPAAAGVLDSVAAAADAALAFAAFCLASSAAYLVNDLADLESDRLHPRKRERPIAAGAISRPRALALALVLLALGLGVAATVSLGLAAVVAAYMLLVAAYSAGLKHVAVLELVLVASGFVLRAIAGGVAVDVPFSLPFLIVACFGSLFLVAGKRAGELAALGESAARVRPVLGRYSAGFLRGLCLTAAAVSVAAYCAWAFEQAGEHTGVPLHELSIVPFVLFVARYARLIESGHGEAPEDLVLGDPPLLGIAAAWILIFAAGVYLGG